MPDIYSRRLLSYLADSRYQPKSVRHLAHELGVDPREFDDFQKSVNQLLDEGQVVFGDADALVLPPPGKQMIGVFRLHERGFGFVVPDDPTANGDLFVPPGNTGEALTGDRVRARVVHEGRRGGGGKSPYTGRVIEIIQRCDRQYVGTLDRRGRRFVVQADGRSMHDPILIRDPDAKNARIGDKVAVEIIKYPGSDGSGGGRDDWPEGVIVEVLGEAGEPEVETRSVMRAYGLAEKFPEQVMDQARAASQQLTDDIPADRDDLTDTFICTIDPPDAKDYDDAISIAHTEDGGYELGVHIADVAHFVQPGSALDEEAYERGNSTYLPRKVIPMLPEVLSNGVCSLQAGVNRFAKSCFITLNAEGRVLDQRFARTVIRSAHRLTYLEAQALIDDDIREARKHTKTVGELKYPRQLIETLKLMDELARVIRKRRQRDGMISLALPDAELVFDESGRVADVEPEDDAFTHTIIEMFMVEANEAAARLFHELDVPMVRRVHPDPDAHDVGELQNFARVAGYNIPAKPSRKELQHLLEATRDKPAQQAVHLAVLRTLSKAEYSPALIGHFALASEHYTHFTSPIRRYPDFVVHRGIDAILDAQQGGGKKKRGIAKRAQQDDRVPNEDELREISRHCSATERNSESAERELRQYLILEFLAEHLGEDFAGTVTGVSSGGAFIQIDRYLADGFVRTNELPGPPNERWRLNPNTGALVAQRSGRTISIGDRFTVRIAKIDLPRRQMDLVVIEESAGDKPAKRKQPKGARKAHQTTQKIKSKKGKDKGKRKETGKGKRKRRG